VAFHRSSRDDGPVRPDPVGHLEERRSLATGHLATGTLACPRCDAPVSPAGGPLSPADPLACPFCGHGAPVRDFLSLAVPSRPARVEVRVVHQGWRALR
jgi:hypothetical protein